MTENHLIKLLPRADRARLLQACKPVELGLSEVLCEPGAKTSHAFFPTTSFISLVTLAPMRIEVGMVGAEGMLGTHLALGVTTSPVRALVQGAGRALRISARDLRDELAQSAALRRIVNRYVYVRMAQLTTSSTCLRFHLIGPRLARWLLMTHDRAGSDTFPVTQEFLGFMLGVRRVGITNAAAAMQREGLISYRRGALTVLNRRGLERRACRCYADAERAYAEQL